MAGIACERAEWLAADGSVLAGFRLRSSANSTSRTSGEHRAPRFASHWAIPDAAAGARPFRRARRLIRYRQIEYYRMPVMAYLALDDARS